MGVKESNIGGEIMVASSKIGATLFRNSKGLFFTQDGRRVAGGLLAKGSADYIGILPVKITENLIGKTIGVFVAIEAKTPTGAVREEQKQFIQFVKNAGGIAGVCRSDADAIKLLSSPFQ